MTQLLPDAEDGCLLLGDISGYSSYLQGSELEHAQDVLADLLETIVAGIEPPFELSKLEGDAVFAYVPWGRTSTPMLLDTIESTYFSFRRRLRDIRHATTCECNACVLIPSLDLKFFVHAGRYVIRRIARSEELTGHDVVLVHRLLKGSAGEAIKSHGYAVYTAVTFEGLGVDANVLGFSRHTEDLTNAGQVEVFVQNLDERWTFEQERQRRTVTAAEALEEVVVDYEAPPAVLWEWLTEPRRRLEYEVGLTGIHEELVGRRGVGTISHCAHGSDVAIQKVVDWRPFTSVTTEERPQGLPIRLTVTRELKATETGTKLTVRLTADDREMWPSVAAQMLPAIRLNFERLQKLLSGLEDSTLQSTE